MPECCEKSLVKWGLKTKSGTLTEARMPSARYGQRMSTTSKSTYLPISPLVIIDILARDAGILAPLVAYYVEGWKIKIDKDGKEYGYKWKPDKRRKATAHAARKKLAEIMEVEEVDEPERE